MKRRCFSLLVLAGALGFAPGCVDTKFHTSATYEAPLSKLRATVDIVGTLRAGRDVSEDGSGNATITSTNPDAPGRVNLEFSGREAVIDRLPSGASEPVPWANLDAGSLREFLGEGGIEATSDEEVREMISVLQGAVSGPKTTRLKGQTEHLVVLEARSLYK